MSESEEDVLETTITSTAHNYPVLWGVKQTFNYFYPQNRYYVVENIIIT